MNKRYQIFVSSTYADLQRERQKVIQTLMEMDCIPAGMELFPAADEEQWEFIKRVIDDCDYYLLIIGGRYGTLTADGISYTEKEYDYAKSIGMSVLAFVHKRLDEITVAKSEIEPVLRTKLEAFRRKVSENRLVKFWHDATELPGLVALSLSKSIKIYPATGWTRASNLPSDELLVDLNNLRKENAQLKSVIANLESCLIPDNTDLASLDEQFSIHMDCRVYKSGINRHYSSEIVLSWGEIFSRIAPDLQEHPPDRSVRKVLSASFSRKLNLARNITASIQHEDFQTIRVQLSALGLVDVNYLKTTSGTMALFWNLTKRGQRLMMKLRTVRVSSTDKTDQ